MARETTEQRNERVAALAAYVASRIETWPKRLMPALERASKNSWEIKVAANNFVVQWTDSYNDRATVSLPLTLTQPDAVDEMEKLEWELDNEDRRKAEYQRKQQLRQSALSKLSKEEREELGL